MTVLCSVWLEGVLFAIFFVFVAVGFVQKNKKIEKKYKFLWQLSQFKIFSINLFMLIALIGMRYYLPQSGPLNNITLKENQLTNYYVDNLSRQNLEDNRAYEVAPYLAATSVGLAPTYKSHLLSGDSKGSHKLNWVSEKEENVWVKRSADNVTVAPNVLGIVSHGNWQTVNQLAGKLLLENIKRTTYVQERIALNKPIFIDLMACQTGESKSGAFSVAQQLSQSLYNRLSKKHDVYVLAPTGNIINIGSYQINILNFRESSWNILGEYKIFKNGIEIYRGILKPNEYFNEINN